MRPCPALGLIAATAAALACTDCMESRYVVQAGVGQLELWFQGRAISDVLDDPDTDARTAFLLSEVDTVRRFANRQGLKTGGSYRHFVELDRGAVVWFMTACAPLSFEPVVWSFPIVGSFPYLGWFSVGEARDIAARLRRRGLDVYVRPVHAYSTGGWFDDPVLSTMLSDEEDAIRSLVNTLLHELVHANVLVNDQSTFNESVASFVGDQMTIDYLAWRFGADSSESLAFAAELEAYRIRGQALAAAYQRLDKLYQSDASDRHKRRDKRSILSQLEATIDLSTAPNNAMLIGFRTYNAGQPELEALFGRCGRSWPRFLQAVRSIDGDDFAGHQDDDIGPVIDAAASACDAASAQKRK